MDQDEALAKAKQFAQTAYAARMNEVLRSHQQKQSEMRSKLAARGMIASGALFTESARLHGEQIRALAVALLETTMEGYELYGITIDDDMAKGISNQVMESVAVMVKKAPAPAFPGSTPSGLETHYPRMVEQNLGLSFAWVKTEIDRRRLMAKKTEVSSTSINVYHVQGSNNRWLTNSQDYSVNVVTQSSDQIFATLRKQVEVSVPDSDEKKDILEKISAMEKSENSASFKDRYTDFIAAAANHMALIAPFIPALSEMLHKVL
jgi:hypothetical protein